jgi:hypothetical protein
LPNEQAVEVQRFVSARRFLRDYRSAEVRRVVIHAKERTLLYVPGRLGESWTGCRHGGDDVGFPIELEIG